MNKIKSIGSGSQNEMDPATKIHHLEKEIAREEQLIPQLKKQGKNGIAKSYEDSLPKKKEELQSLLNRSKES